MRFERHMTKGRRRVESGRSRSTNHRVPPEAKSGHNTGIAAITTTTTTLIIHKIFKFH